MIRIRTARSEDCDAVAAMVHDLARMFGVNSGTTGEGLRHEAFGARPTLAILVAEDGTTGSLVGYVIHQDVFSTYSGHNGVFIVDLYVVPERRNDGLGVKLLAEAARQGWARGATFVRLDVEPENAAAMRLYSRLGFKDRGYRVYGLDEPDFSRLLDLPN